jgi:hypothetical protein
MTSDSADGQDNLTTERSTQRICPTIDKHSRLKARLMLGIDWLIRLLTNFLAF